MSACSCCGRPDPQISPTTNSPAKHISRTLELFPCYRCTTKAHNIMLGTVLYVSTHTNEPRKSPITLKYLTTVLAKAPSITPPHLKTHSFCCMDIFGLNMFFKYSVGVLVKQRVESHVIASKCTKNEVLLLQWGLSAVHFNSSERAEAPGFAFTYY